MGEAVYAELEGISETAAHRTVRDSKHTVLHKSLPFVHGAPRSEACGRLRAVQYDSLGRSPVA